MILVSKSPLMVSYPYREGTVSFVLHPQWEPRLIAFIEKNDFIIGTDLDKEHNKHRQQIGNIINSLLNHVV